MIMSKKQKSYTLNFLEIDDEKQADAIIKSLAKNAIQSQLAKHGAVSYNLDDVLNKYISGEMCNGKKEK